MTAAIQYLREMDRVTTGAPLPGPVTLDLTAMDFAWVSGFALPASVVRIHTRVVDGQVMVNAVGRGEPRPGDWGEVPAGRVFTDSHSSRSAVAFHATFDNGSVRSHLQTNMNHGVCVLHGFHHVDGYRPFYTREFYLPARRPDDDGGAPGAAELPEQLRRGHTEPGELVGTWRNRDPHATGLSRVECMARDGGLVLRVHGSGPEGESDWGECGAELFADSLLPTLPPAFIASYDHGFMRMHLQARLNRGILVICQFAEFVDGSGRSSYFIREFFRK